MSGGNRHCGDGVDQMQVGAAISCTRPLVWAVISCIPPWSCESLLCAGQVQDVGLIFISSIASSVVAQCSEAGWTAENTLATVLMAVTAATGIVGLLIIGTGEAVPQQPKGWQAGRGGKECSHGCRLVLCPTNPLPAAGLAASHRACPCRHLLPVGALKLAGIVQYVPLPVVGGYL